MADDREKRSHFEDSNALCEYIRELNGDTVILSFSTGKDSVGAWLQLRQYFRRIIPLYLYTTPGLSFVENSLKYYEDFFGTRIVRLPHPSFYRMLNALVFQSPENCHIVEDADLPNFDYDQCFDIVREDFGLGLETFAAIGVRARDSLNRWASVKKYGPVNYSRKTFFPIFDYTIDDLRNLIRESGVRLPLDYKLFGRSFDGIDWRFLQPIKDNLPDDYRRILEWFPLAELAIKRMEYRQRYYDRLESDTKKETQSFDPLANLILGE